MHLSIHIIYRSQSGDAAATAAATKDPAAPGGGGGSFFAAAAAAAQRLAAGGGEPEVVHFSGGADSDVSLEVPPILSLFREMGLPPSLILALSLPYLSSLSPYLRSFPPLSPLPPSLISALSLSPYLRSLSILSADAHTERYKVPLRTCRPRTRRTTRRTARRCASGPPPPRPLPARCFRRFPACLMKTP